MSKLAICIDNSGSTNNSSFYWDNVKTYVNETVSSFTGDIEYFKWNDYCSKIENITGFLINPNSNNYTILSNVIATLRDKHNIKSFTDLLIISDGDIHPIEIKTCSMLLKELNLSWNVRIILCADDKLTESLFEPFTSCKNITITFNCHNLKFTHKVTTLPKTLEGFKELFNNIDWPLLYLDSLYQNKLLIDITAILKNVVKVMLETKCIYQK